MREKELHPYQRRLGEEGELERYLFPKGTMIWPKYSGRGILTQDCYAKRLNCKIRGLTGFKSCEPLFLRLDERHWTLPEGTTFGAYVKTGKKRKIK
ncbi:MAG: hypothetical protein ACPLKP_01835 [Microgenomates group bacterium]